MIKIKNLFKNYLINSEEESILENINIEIKKGDMICIAGISGSGKSTLLNIIGLIDKPTKGSLFIDNSEINFNDKKLLARIRNEKISFIFQNNNLIEYYDVYDNVVLPYKYRKEKLPGKDEIKNLLNNLGIGSKINEKICNLSGGEKQRVSIARALASNSNIILADEPTSALDSKSRDKFLNLVKEINLSGVTVIIVTHDLSIAKWCNKTLYIEDGKISTKI